MPHVNVTTSASGSNAGSSGGLVEYLEKENKLKPEDKAELWFNQQRDDLRAYEVRQGIDGNTGKLKQSEAKFYLVNISPSQKELAHIGNDPHKLKDYARSVMAEYAANFKKGLGPDDVKWYGKVEYNRSYKWTDADVKQGLHQRGDQKAGAQLHVQIIVSRKDANNKRLLSPLTNHRGQGKSAAHGQKFGQFNRVEFKERSEAVFDQQLGYRREVQESFRYQNTMSHGTVLERVDLIVSVRDQERERAAEQQRQAEQLRQAEQQRQTEQLRQQQEQTRRQEQEQLLQQEPQRRRRLSL